MANNSQAFMSNFTNFTGNFTTTAVPVLSTAPIVAVMACTTTTGFLSNSLLLYLFAKKPSMRTQFNIYLINLLLANLGTVMFQYPLDIANSFENPGWLFGDGTCTLYLYAIWILEAGMYNSHQLIAINRLWAILHPLSYRTYHTTKVAVCLCCIMWIYLHVTALPLLILDTMFYRYPVRENGCTTNGLAQKDYNITLNVFFYCWPLLLMWIALPIVHTVKVLRQRNWSRRSGVVRVHSVQTTGKHPPLNGEAAGERDTGRQPIRPGRSPIQSSNSHATGVLVILTLSVTIFWTPSVVFFILDIFISDFDSTHETFRAVSLALLSVQTTVDPIVFLFTVRPLREAGRAVLRCRSSRIRQISLGIIGQR